MLSIPSLRLGTAALACAGSLLAGLGPAAPARAADLRPAASGCTDRPPTNDAGRKALDFARTAMKTYNLKAATLEVDEGGRTLVTEALGESMTGVPAEPDMNFRAGSVGIAFMTTALLQLVDAGVVRLSDPVSRWLPDLPHGGQITLGMLGSSTSGLRDYVSDSAFLAQLNAAPFRQWTPSELIAFPLSHPLWYAPGTNWSYSHANFVLLGEALERISGTRLDRLLDQRVIKPLGLRSTRNNYTPEIPSPALHAFTTGRGPYEESTYWNPSWTTAPGAVITMDTCDLATSAKGLGAGVLLTPQSYRTLLDPGTVGLGGPTADCPVCIHNTQAKHYGLGVEVVNDWVLQNPSFSGYAAEQAYLPGKDVSIAVSVTQGPGTPDDQNIAEVIAGQIGTYLAPDHPLS